MTNQKGKIVALYVRVSTGYQVDKDSLPFQKKELKAYCEHVLHVDKKRIEVFEDAGKSGKNTKRPAFERMMEKVKRGKCLMLWFTKSTVSPETLWISLSCMMISNTTMLRSYL